ncbi:uncharacterized protein [Primulina eburnea]|uniref:uncharacterized protein n=1 Tax=Primulina eburnea TaxID=1245227 RepID=UPI003C6C9290
MADNRENDRQMPPEAIPIRDHFRPVINTHYSGIARGTINANNFELKPALINMVQQNRFGGATTADPHLHLRTFLEITDTVSALTAQIAAMNKPGQSTSDVALVTAAEEPVVEEAQYINNRGYGGYRDLVGTFVVESGKRMSRTESRLDNLEPHMASIGATLKILESQVGQITKQLTSQPSGAVQKNADPNLREVNAIFMQHEEIGVVGKEKKVDQPPPSKRSRGKKGKSYDFDQCVDISLLPYPQRFLQLKAEFQKKKGLEDLKNLHSNIQFAEQEEVTFTGGDYKEKQGNLPQKLQDPGEFVVPCEIRGKLVENAICDSGASVNIMPSSLYEKLGLSRIKPTGLSLQMADKSVRTPLGVVEDVELKIDKIKLLADFVVLDMGNSQNVRAILGRPFLATAGAVIDLRQGKLTMAVDGQHIELKASKISYDPP